MVKARENKGVLIASGLIAGAAIIGVFKSFLNIVSESTLKAVDVSGIYGGNDSASNWAGLIAFIGLGLFVYLNSRSAKPIPGAEDAPSLGGH